jgi:hypothetical protein
MINTLKREPMLVASLAVVMLTMAAPAFSQAPTDAQRSAIRSQCRADYQAHCASVPPGGAASLQCLQQNMSSLSPGCQGAVRAVDATAEPKPAEAKPAEAKPAEAKPAEAKPEPSPAAPAAATANPAPATAAPPAAGTAAATKPAATRKPNQAQVAAIRSACRSDYQKNCAGVPTGGAAALQCLEKNKSKLSANCDKAVSAASDGAAPPAAGGASAVAAPAGPAAVPAAAPAFVLRPMRPREELFVLRSACGGDVRALCGGVPPGGGRIMQCLATQAASLSPACKDVLSQFATQ